MVVRLIVFLSSANLICRSTDISKCFIVSLGFRDFEITRVDCICFWLTKPTGCKKVNGNTRKYNFRKPMVGEAEIIDEKSGRKCLIIT